MTGRSGSLRLAIFGLLLARAPRGVQRVVAYMAVGALLTMARRDPGSLEAWGCPSSAPSRAANALSVPYEEGIAGMLTIIKASLSGVHSLPWLCARLGLLNVKMLDQADYRRRRHQPRTPTLAKIRPGRPAPAMGLGTRTPGRNASGPVPNSNMTELIIGLGAPKSAILNVPKFCIYGSKLSNPPVWPL